MFLIKQVQARTKQISEIKSDNGYQQSLPIQQVWTLDTEKFCNFSHETKKCSTINCDVKRCNFRHPKNCKYVLNNIKCKFEVFCSFEHDIEGLVQQEETEDKIKILERLIEDKDEEIESLRKRLREFDIIQHYGDFMIDHESESENETSDQESVDDIINIEEDMNSKDNFKCDHCEFITKHKNGLKIHIGRVHKLKCEDCDQNFQDEECLQRHKSAKKILANIDPHLSPFKP